MYKKNLIKATSVFTAFALACSTMTGCGLFNKNEDTANAQDITEENPEAENLVETMTQAAFTGNRENADSGKEETVYVMTDANGAVDEVVVSNWLKNANGDKTITDKTNLKDIVNVKGEESYKDNGDGTVTWDAEGQDIYYQGTPTEEVPVGVKVTYELDGKQMKAEDIAGKSGNVKIRFDYTNSLKKEVEVDGEKEDVEVPFTMISGTMLDSEKFANVHVSNGKVISDANNYVVVGVALPGLKESLDIDEEKLDEKLEEEGIDKEDVEIPDYVEITADVQDFELPMTISMASANAVSDLGLNKIYDSDKLDNVNDDMDKLSDASTQLRDGSGELADGTEKLEDGTGELYDGTKELKDGTGELKDGTKELKNGTGELKDGASQLKDGSGQLKDGTGELDNGAGQLKDGASKLSTGIGEYTDGVGQLSKGTKTLDDGVTKLKDGATTLTGGITSAKDGAKSLSEGAAQLSTGINTATDTVKQQMEAVKSASDTFYKEFAAVINYAASSAGKGAEKGAAQSSSISATDAAALNTLLNQASQKLAGLYTIDAVGGLEVLSVDTPVIVENNNSQADDKKDPSADQATDNTENKENTENEENPANNETPQNEGTNEETPSGNEDNSQGDQEQQNNASDEQSGDQNSDDAQQNDQQEKQQNDQQMADNQDGQNVQTEPSSQDEQGNSSDESGNDTSSQTPAVDSQDQGSDEAVTLGADTAVDGEFDDYSSDGDWAYIEKNTGISHAQWTQMYMAAKASIDSQADQEKFAASLKALCDQIKNEMNEGDKEAGVAQAAYTEAMTYKAKAEGEAAEAQQLAAQAKEAGAAAQEAAAGGDMTTAGAKQAEAQQLAGQAQAKGAQAQSDGAKAQEKGQEAQDSKEAAMDHYTKAVTMVANTLVQTKNATQYATTIYMTYRTLATSAGTLDTLYNGTGNGGLKDIQAGASKLATGANTLYDGMKKLDNGGSTLATGIGTLKDGTRKLKDGADKLESNSGALKDGGSKLSDGASKLAEGTGKLKDGAGKLDEGIGKLYDGTVKLDDGAGKLDDGAGKLDDGAGKLKDGAKELQDGAVKLNDGARKLADGMIEFDEDGIQKITGIVDDDLLSVTDRLKAVDEASQSYTSFSGANDDEPSTVQFIIRTAPVKAD